MSLESYLNKSFYCCIDSLLPATQPEQHILCNKISEQNNGKIIFYGAEEVLVLKDQPYIYKKLKRTPNIDGVVFFTVDQFCYGEKFNLNLMKKILKLQMSIHFAREQVSFNSIEDLANKLPIIISYHHSFIRSRKMFAKETKYLLSQ